MNEIKCPKCGTPNEMLENGEWQVYEVEGKENEALSDGTGHYRGNWTCENCETDFRVEYSFTWQFDGEVEYKIWD